MAAFVRAIGAAMLIAGIGTARIAVAHEDRSAQIADVSRRIELRPDDVDLYLRRSELYRERHEWQQAMADLQSAQRLDPALAIVDLHAALTLFDADNPSAALTSVDRFLVHHAGHAGAHLLRARILVRLGSRDDAAAEFTRGIELARTSGQAVTPDDHLERARIVASQGGTQVDEAIRGLDEAASGASGAITLKLLAIELETARGSFDAAIERLAAIERGANRKETWIARRGDVLWSAGRHDEAVAAWRSALAAIDALPVRLRTNGATSALAENIRARLDEEARSTGDDPTVSTDAARAPSPDLSAIGEPR